MSSLKQPAQKRPRCESNNNYNTCISPNTNINLLSLPDEALNNIISYSLPQKECQVWEWIGRLSHTCRSFRRFAQTYAPTRIVLKDFARYSCLNSSERYVDNRVGFLQSLRDCSWKRHHLKELHVNPESVLLEREDEESRYPIYKECCNDIKALLRTLLFTSASFPELEWLDIELQSDNVYDYDLINAETLRLMPDALPALHKLCLSHCLTYRVQEISTHWFR